MVCESEIALCIIKSEKGALIATTHINSRRLMLPFQKITSRPRAAAKITNNSAPLKLIFSKVF